MKNIQILLTAINLTNSQNKTLMTYKKFDVEKEKLLLSRNFTLKFRASFYQNTEPFMYLVAR